MKNKEKSTVRNRFSVLLVLLVLLLFLSSFAQDSRKKQVKRMVFEGAKIEGQMGTVKALIVTSDKRPEFSPMALQLSHQKLELKNINKKIVEGEGYSEVFSVKIPNPNIQKDCVA